MSDTASAEKDKSRRLGRSPAYPSFSVQKALEQIKALYEQEKEYAAPFASALKAWGYGAKSSGGRQTLATMKYYGLVDITGEGDARRIKVSEMALKILRDPREDDTEKRQMIHRVAMNPAAHKLLAEEYPTGLASDGTVQYFLMESGFNEQAARELLEEFKETASFISLYDPQKPLDKVAEKGDSEAADELPPAISVGDKVQVTVAGTDLYADGATVLGFSDDGTWVFIDKSDSAAKLEEVTLIEAAAPRVLAQERPQVPAHLLSSKGLDEKLREGWQEERLLDDKGGEIFLRYEGEVSAERYEFIRDYLDFKLSRLKSSLSKNGIASGDREAK